MVLEIEWLLNGEWGVLDEEEEEEWVGTACFLWVPPSHVFGNGGCLHADDAISPPACQSQAARVPLRCRAGPHRSVTVVRHGPPGPA